MIELFQYPPAFNLPSPSPFCLKLELALKLANIRYSNRYDADVRKAPKAKLPYVIIDGTQTIADSDLVLRYLKDSSQFTADEWLSDVQTAMCVAITRLVEDHLYWLLVDARWLNEEVWPVLKDTFFAGLPPVVRSIVPGVVRRHVRRTLYGHGLGRHSPQELTWFAERDLEALDGLLGEQAYMLGERICSVDASVYGMLASIYYPDFDTPLKVAALKHPRLAAYCDRITAQFFPDYDRVQSRLAHS